MDRTRIDCIVRVIHTQKEMHMAAWHILSYWRPLVANPQIYSL